MSLLTFKSILSSFRTTLVTPLDDFYSREDPLLKHTREYEDAYSNLLELISNSGRSDIYPHLSDLFLFVGSILGKELYEGYDSRLGGIINGAKALLHALLLLFDTSSARYLLLFPSNQLDPSSIPIAQNITHICTKAIATTRIDNQPVLFSRLPMCQNALVWLGMQLSYPELSDPPFMHVFQPLCLQLTEDFREDAIKCGFELLEHFSINCRTADWRDNSRAEAVLSQLLNRRFISDPNSSSAVLQSLFKCIFALAKHLESPVRSNYMNQLSESLLAELNIESKLDRRYALCQILLFLSKNFDASLTFQMRKFISALESVLLCPRVPTMLSNSSSRLVELNTFLLMVQCTRHIVSSFWPLFSSPFVLVRLIPLLVSFIDMEAKDDTVLPKQAQQPSSSSETKAMVLEEIRLLFITLIYLRPEIYHAVLVPASFTIPALRNLVINGEAANV